VSLRKGSRALRLVLVGGTAERQGFTASDADPWELRMGSKHELEHTGDRAIAKQIALDHLAEDPRYYSMLKSCETATKTVKTRARCTPTNTEVAIDSSLQGRIAALLPKRGRRESGRRERGRRERGRRK